jgi:hypothetical protein
LGVSNEEGVIDFVGCSSMISDSSSSTRAAAATGFATGKKILLGRLHPGNDVLEICAIWFVYMFGVVVVVLVMSASRIDDVIIDGKRKRFSFLLLIRGIGHDSLRLVVDDFVDTSFADVDAGC